ncbi:MAG: DUF177 domain-containing protein [Pedobacter sp.]|nr:MAG: DUF177 domain-containing protein [Pedobacter sp.]
MKALKQFTIPFSGLKLGKHQFELEIDKDFFDAYEYSLVKDGTLKANLELDKQETMLILNFDIQGSIQLSCDTCLADFAQPVNIKEKQIVKFADDELTNEDLEIMVISRKDSEIEVADLIYEYITISVPYVNNCEQAGVTCDPEMLQTLQKFSARDTEQTEESKEDPRWAALKKLK